MIIHENENIPHGFSIIKPPWPISIIYEFNRRCCPIIQWKFQSSMPNLEVPWLSFQF